MLHSFYKNKKMIELDTHTYGENMQKINIGEIYRHYKGNTYKIIAIAKHSESTEEMIVYQSTKDSQVWVRPSSMWNNIIDDAGTLRFTLVDKS